MERLEKYPFLLGSAVLIFVITAINSIGFHHFDEHFQILEFAGYKLGFNELSDLPWEYGEAMRSGFQPFVAYSLLKGMNSLNITNPHTQAIFLRLFSSCLVFFCIFYFIKHHLNDFKTNQKWFVILSFGSFFIPYLAARFSSESWSGAFLILGITLLFSNINKNNNKILISGIVLALSFLCRYQTGLCLAGLGLWLIFIHKISLRDISFLAGGFFIGNLFGILMDFWLYGDWVFPVYHYFEQNILESKAAQFGVSPWYYYFILMTRYGWFSILPLLISIFYLLFLLLKPKHLLTFIFIPFILIHFITGHKELRFLFPILFFAPYVVLVVWDIINQRFSGTFLSGVGVLLLALNFIGLILNAIKPADGHPKVYQKIGELTKGNDVELFYPDEKQHFHKAQARLNIHFYNRNKWPLKQMSLVEPDIININPKKISLLLVRKSTPFQHPDWQWVDTTESDWLTPLNKDNFLHFYNNNWNIFRYKNEQF